jgi:hypothetical protein
MRHKTYLMLESLKYSILRVKTLMGANESRLEQMVKEEKPRLPTYICECSDGVKLYATHEQYLNMPYAKQLRYKKLE